MNGLQRKISLVLAFLLPPMIVGGLAAVSTVKKVMRHAEPAAVTLKSGPAPLPSPVGWSPKAASALPTVLFVLNPSGTETLNLLGPWELLARSGLFRLVTAAPRRALVATTAGVSVLPDYAFADAPAADYLWVLPGVDPLQPEVLTFLKERAVGAKGVLAPCEAVRTAGAAGLLSEQTEAACPALAEASLAQQFPAIRWNPSARVHASGRLWTSAGITGSLDAAIEFIAQANAETAARVSEETAWQRPAARSSVPLEQRLTRGELARLLLELGFGWGKTYYSIALETGVSELALAAWLEIASRGLSTRVNTVSSQRAFARSAHGLILVATDGMEQAFPPHFLIFPSQPALARPSTGLFSPPKRQAFAVWEDQVRVPTLHFEDRRPAEQFDLAFTHAQEGGRLGSLVRVVARFMEWPMQISAPTPAQDWRTWGYLMRFALLGALGVWAYLKILKILAAKKSPRNSLGTS